MRRRPRTRAAILALVLAAAPPLPLGVATAQSRGQYDPPQADVAPPALADVGIEQRLGAQVPLDLAFRDERGAPVTLAELVHDKPVVLALAYYECPMLCTLVLNGLVRALRALRFDVGDEFEVVTVSFDPREGPALAAAKREAYLREYRRPGAERGWHFLTGEAEAIAALADAVGFRYRWLPEREEFAHAAAIVVLTPGGQVARYFYGVEYSPRDLRLGLVEAARGTIGSPVDQLLLYCYAYDPATGRYGAVAMSLVRLGGVLTVVLLGGFVVVTIRRERAARSTEANGASGVPGRVGPGGEG